MALSQTDPSWGTYNYASLWVAMSVCIPTYMLASGVIAECMNWIQAILTILLGHLIVLIPMLLNAHAGTKYGIPSPVFVPASLGVRSANVPAILRALVACGWFGIQTWIGGQAIYSMLRILWPASANFHGAAWFCFFLFWCVNRSAARLWFSPSKIFFARLAAQSPGVFPGLRRQTSCASLAVRAARRQLRQRCEGSWPQHQNDFWRRA
jgi:NCS1 nucleoside transporter family